MKHRFLAFIAIAMLSISQVSATHIVAGFSSYEHISGNTYQINFTIIRDIFTNGALLDEDIVIQIYTHDAGIYEHEGNALASLDSTQEFEFTNTQYADPSNIGFEYGVYSINYELTESDKDYQFVFQRCCRNPLFSNLVNPLETGISLFSTITRSAQAFQNSSITFDKLPPVLVPVNVDYNSPIKAISLDADTLIYQFSPTYIGGGLMGIGGPQENVNSCDGLEPHGPCFPPYSQTEYFPSNELNFSAPFPAWDDLGINPGTGDILGTPRMIGRFAYGFTVHEFRDNELINSTNFDYMIDVVDFVSSVEQINSESIKVLGNPSDEIFSIQLDGHESYNFGVYNLEGQQIDFDAVSKNNQIEIRINGPSGIYFLNAFNHKTSKTIKLVKL